MVLVDAIARRLPGALAEGSGEHESFSAELDGGLEYPHYTRPATYRGWDVPDVLLSGDHGQDRALAPRAEPPPERRVSGIDERETPREVDAPAEGELPDGDRTLPRCRVPTRRPRAGGRPPLRRTRSLSTDARRPASRRPNRRHHVRDGIRGTPSTG